MYSQNFYKKWFIVTVSIILKMHVSFWLKTVDLDTNLIQLYFYIIDHSFHIHNQKCIYSFPQDCPFYCLHFCSCFLRHKVDSETFLQSIQILLYSSSLVFPIFQHRHRLDHHLDQFHLFWFDEGIFYGDWLYLVYHREVVKNKHYNIRTVYLWFWQFLLLHFLIILQFIPLLLFLPRKK